MRDRELYEAEIAEREARDGRPLKLASFRISVDPIFLRSVQGSGCLDAIAPGVGVNELTNDHIKYCSNSRG